VGTDKARLAVRAGGAFLVAPDNGLVWPLLEARGGRFEARKLRVPRGAAPTFHGRDVFAPAAARLAAGLPLGECGPEVTDWVTLPGFRPVSREGGHETEIIRVDRFGNLITTLEEGFLRSELGEDWRRLRVRVGSAEIQGVGLSYADVAPGEALATIGGSGTLEISVSAGSARRKLGQKAGDRVLVLPPPE
jgi:S-adenosylmethionine hydrolase